MKRRHVLFGSLLVLCAGACALTPSYESAYRPTPVGTVEIRELPATRRLTATHDGGYFDSADSLFMTLFRYISSNEVAMTVPVESDVDSSRMHFIVGTPAKKRDLPQTDEVTIEDRPAGKVASIGRRGGYTKAAYEAALKDLQDWLSERKDIWTIAGSPVAVYWNGPFVPPALKRFEVHLPVVERESAPEKP